jgi:hypothetical protein
MLRLRAYQFCWIFYLCDSSLGKVLSEVVETFTYVVIYVYIKNSPEKRCCMAADRDTTSLSSALGSCGCGYLNRYDVVQLAMWYYILCLCVVLLLSITFVSFFLLLPSCCCVTQYLFFHRRSFTGAPCIFRGASLFSSDIFLLSPLCFRDTSFFVLAFYLAPCILGVPFFLSEVFLFSPLGFRGASFFVVGLFYLAPCILGVPLFSSKIFLLSLLCLRGVCFLLEVFYLAPCI